MRLRIRTLVRTRGQAGQPALQHVRPTRLHQRAAGERDPGRIRAVPLVVGARRKIHVVVRCRLARADEIGQRRRVEQFAGMVDHCHAREIVDGHIGFAGKGRQGQRENLTPRHGFGAGAGDEDEDGDGSSATGLSTFSPGRV